MCREKISVIEKSKKIEEYSILAYRYYEIYRTCFSDRNFKDAKEALVKSIDYSKLVLSMVTNESEKAYIETTIESREIELKQRKLR